MAWCQVNMDRVGEAEKMQIHTEVDILKSLTHKVNLRRQTRDAIIRARERPCADVARVPDQRGGWELRPPLALSLGCMHADARSCIALLHLALASRSCTAFPRCVTLRCTLR